MKLFKYDKLDEISEFIGTTLAQLGSADPGIKVNILAAGTRKLQRSGRSEYNPSVELNAPIVEGVVSGEFAARAAIVREFAKNGSSLVLIEISRDSS